MSICPYVYEQGMFNLAKRAERCKNQITDGINNRNLKQAHNKKLAESFEPIIKKMELDKKQILKTKHPLN